MAKTTMGRRTFLGQTAAALALAPAARALGANARVIGANDRIRLGIIGIGNIGLTPVNDDTTGKFLGDAGGLWKSTDFGTNWTQVVGNSQNFANELAV